jgi:putative membrane protein
VSARHPTTDQSPVAPASSSEQPAEPASSAPAVPQPRRRVRGTRTGHTWVAACAAALITVALIIFMLQNTHTVQVNFLGLTGSTSLSLMLLIAAVGGILLTLILGSARILQLRRAVRKPR